jgi:hypothetical protein
MVTVANHYQHGIIIFGQNGEKFVVKGLATTLPAAVWDGWLAQNIDSPLVKNGSIVEVSRI